jgi:hypothetical protein
LESDLRDLRRKRLLLAANNPSLELIDFVLMCLAIYSPANAHAARPLAKA